MKQTMLLKLAPTEEQRQALLETMHAFNAAANYVGNVAYTNKSTSKFDLQKECYADLRATYKLSAQLAILAIHKAAGAYNPHSGQKGLSRMTNAL